MTLEDLTQLALRAWATNHGARRRWMSSEIRRCAPEIRRSSAACAVQMNSIAQPAQRA